MTEKGQVVESVNESVKESVKEIGVEDIPQEVPSSDTDLEEFHYESMDPESDFDLEEEYLNKLKIQRKRIEQLSSLHQKNQERIQKQIQKNRALSEQIQKLSSQKEYQTRYSEVISSMEMTTQENKSLKEQLNEYKQQVMQAAMDKANAIQKLRAQLTLQKDRESHQIEHLEEELASKQDEIDKLCREQRARERTLQETISDLKNKITSVEVQYQNLIKTEQKKVEKLERDLNNKNSAGSNAQLNAEALLKENVQLKEENFRLQGELSNKDIEFRSMFEKLKLKIANLKKDLKTKQKECSEFRESIRKYEKDASEYTSETETLRIEIKRVKESLDNEKTKWESDFSKQKQSLQAIVDRQNSKISELQADRKYLQEQNMRLQLILRKKENAQKQRKYLLKTEMKQIDKLQKVIDRIVD